MNALLIPWAIIILIAVGYLFYDKWQANKLIAQKQQIADKEKELAVIQDQVKIVKEEDVKKEKSYDEAKADYDKRYHSNDESGS